MPEYEYRTELLTSIVGREKLRLDELDEILRDHGREGWELVTLVPEADIQGGRNGHLLVFKRAKG